MPFKPPTQVHQSLWGDVAAAQDTGGSRARGVGDLFADVDGGDESGNGNANSYKVEAGGQDDDDDDDDDEPVLELPTSGTSGGVSVYVHREEPKLNEPTTSNSDTVQPNDRSSTELDPEIVRSKIPVEEHVASDEGKAEMDEEMEDAAVVLAMKKEVDDQVRKEAQLEADQQLNVKRQQEQERLRKKRTDTTFQLLSADLSLDEILSSSSLAVSSPASSRPDQARAVAMTGLSPRQSSKSASFGTTILVPGEYSSTSASTAMTVNTEASSKPFNLQDELDKYDSQQKKDTNGNRPPKNTVSTEKQQSFTCPVCEKSLASLHKLNVHLDNTHPPESSVEKSSSSKQHSMQKSATLPARTDSMVDSKVQQEKNNNSLLRATTTGDLTDSEIKTKSNKTGTAPPVATFPSKFQNALDFKKRNSAISTSTSSLNNNEGAGSRIFSWFRSTTSLNTSTASLAASSPRDSTTSTPVDNSKAESLSEINPTRINQKEDSPDRRSQQLSFASISSNPTELRHIPVLLLKGKNKFLNTEKGISTNHWDIELDVGKRCGLSSCNIIMTPGATGRINCRMCGKQVCANHVENLFARLNQDGTPFDATVGGPSYRCRVCPTCFESRPEYAASLGTTRDLMKVFKNQRKVKSDRQNVESNRIESRFSNLILSYLDHVEVLDTAVKVSAKLTRSVLRQIDVSNSYFWVPDSTSVACMSCHKAIFTQFTRRRHHCRLCGILICKNCSYMISINQYLKKVIIPKIKFKVSEASPTSDAGVSRAHEQQQQPNVNLPFLDDDEAILESNVHAHRNEEHEENNEPTQGTYKQGISFLVSDFMQLYIPRAASAFKLSSDSVTAHVQPPPRVNNNEYLDSCEKLQELNVRVRSCESCLSTLKMAMATVDTHPNKNVSTSPSEPTPEDEKEVSEKVTSLFITLREQTSSILEKFKERMDILVERKEYAHDLEEEDAIDIAEANRLRNSLMASFTQIESLGKRAMALSLAMADRIPAAVDPSETRISRSEARILHGVGRAAREFLSANKVALEMVPDARDRVKKSQQRNDEIQALRQQHGYLMGLKVEALHARQLEDVRLFETSIRDVEAALAQLGVDVPQL